ncbi:MAG: hypothetical protein WD270_14230 [Acetobacterales bacterium]
MAVESKKTPEQAHAAERVLEHFDRIAGDPAVGKGLLLQNLGLFIRNSGLAKILFVNDLYERVLDRPGLICEFGCHLGQNLVLFENLRAIYEPFNVERRIVGFDNFQTAGGYPSVDAARDGDSTELTSDAYSLPAGYADMLRDLLRFHEGMSVYPDHPRCEVVAGDATATVPRYLAEHEGESVALAYFDMATYGPTRACLDAVAPRLLPGSLLVADEFNFRRYPGASRAFLEWSAEAPFHLDYETSRYMRDRTLVRVGARR